MDALQVAHEAMLPGEQEVSQADLYNYNSSVNSLSQMLAGSAPYMPPGLLNNLEGELQHKSYVSGNLLTNFYNYQNALGSPSQGINDAEIMAVAQRTGDPHLIEQADLQAYQPYPPYTGCPTPPGLVQPLPFYGATPTGGCNPSYPSPTGSYIGGNGSSSGLSSVMPMLNQLSQMIGQLSGSMGAIGSGAPQYPPIGSLPFPSAGPSPYIGAGYSNPNVPFQTGGGFAPPSNLPFPTAGNGISNAANYAFPNLIP
jgi:hypothetical protein